MGQSCVVQSCLANKCSRHFFRTSSASKYPWERSRRSSRKDSAQSCNGPTVTTCRQIWQSQPWVSRKELEETYLYSTCRKTHFLFRALTFIPSGILRVRQLDDPTAACVFLVTRSSLLRLCSICRPADMSASHTASFDVLMTQYCMSYLCHPG
jgi:hypothetical protein